MQLPQGFWQTLPARTLEQVARFRVLPGGGVKCTVLMENFAMKSDQAKTASIETPTTK